MNEWERKDWIPFGDRDTQVLHPETAAAVLKLMCERHRALFGALLAEALTGEPPKIRRPR